MPAPSSSAPSQSGGSSFSASCIARPASLVAANDDPGVTATIAFTREGYLKFWQKTPVPDSEKHHHRCHQRRHGNGQHQLGAGHYKPQSRLIQPLRCPGNPSLIAGQRAAGKQDGAQRWGERHGHQGRGHNRHQVGPPPWGQKSDPLPPSN